MEIQLIFHGLLVYKENRGSVKFIVNTRKSLQLCKLDTTAEERAVICLHKDLSFAQTLI